MTYAEIKINIFNNDEHDRRFKEYTLLQTTRCAGQTSILPYSSCNGCDKDRKINIEALAKNQHLSQSHSQRKVKCCQETAL